MITFGQDVILTYASKSIIERNLMIIELFCTVKYICKYKCCLLSLLVSETNILLCSAHSKLSKYILFGECIIY